MQNISASTSASRLAWFNDARFGMFIHWGIYSTLGRGEWVMRHEGMPLEQYAKLADRFNPKRFDADRWVAQARDAGMKYLVLTARHHDGFCLFDSQTDDFTSVKTAAGRDFVAEYVAACRRGGMKVGLYYSLTDWRHGIRDVNESWEGMEKQRQLAHAQVRELMSNYGKIDLLWYDGTIFFPTLAAQGGPKNTAEFFESAKLNKMVRSLQPDILINNRSGIPEDFGTPEQQIRAPKETNAAWECCMTIGDERGWGYLRHDPTPKSPAFLVQTLATCAAMGGNFLLNVSPRGNGEIPAAQARTLRKIGEWMRVNGCSIHGVAPSSMSGGSCGFFVHAEDCIYLHIFWWPGKEAYFRNMQEEVISATILKTGQSLEVGRTADGRLVLKGLPSHPPDPFDTVIRIQTRAYARVA